MTTTPEQRVTKGAELLDRVRPGWELLVSEAMLQGLFDMGDPRRCVLGTLELVRSVQGGTILDAEPDVTFNGTRLTSWYEAQQYGFNTVAEGEGYEELEKLWAEQVQARLEEATE